MADWTLEKKGFDRLQLTLKKAADMRPFEEAMRESLKVLQQEASRFPPQPNRMRSGHLNTWVREIGRLPTSAFRATKGAMRKSIRNTFGILQPSEKMLAKWKSAQPQIRKGAGYIIGRITNAASYGVYVQGERQPKFHALTGWKTTQQIQQMHAARILKVFENALKRALEQ